MKASANPLDQGPACIHCGKSGHRHLGPRQWCPRGQKQGEALKAFTAKPSILPDPWGGIFLSGGPYSS